MQKTGRWERAQGADSDPLLDCRQDGEKSAADKEDDRKKGPLPLQEPGRRGRNHEGKVTGEISPLKGMLNQLNS